jgi:RNA polymerase sigma factor (sigma-70 family)
MPSSYSEPVAPDHTAEIADRDYLLRALATLPPRQRAVLVLRYFDDLSEGETAQMLGCSLGTVKSHAARGLSRLRQAAEAQPVYRLAEPPVGWALPTAPEVEVDG